MGRRNKNYSTYESENYIMIKRRKLNILMALAMAMTLMFGSTVCFAAETDDVAEAVEQERAVARMQSGTVTKSGSYSFSAGVLVSYEVNIEAEWDEGYSSKVKGGSTGKLTISPSSMADKGYNAIMYRNKVKDNTIWFLLLLRDSKNNVVESATLTFSVDSYGCVN